MAIENIVKANADILGLLLPHCPIVDCNSVEGTDVLHFDVNGKQVMISVYNKSNTARELTKRNIERVMEKGMVADSVILADNIEKMIEYRSDMTGMSADIIDMAMATYLSSENVAEATPVASIE